MERGRLLLISVTLAANALLSWTVLPLAIPPFRMYTLSEVGETLMWQGIGAIGWPLAIPGAILALAFGAQVKTLGPLLMTLAYPAILFLTVHTLTARVLRPWLLVLLHMLLALSFAAVWWHVLHGYDFMLG